MYIHIKYVYIHCIYIYIQIHTQQRDRERERDRGKSISVISGSVLRSFLLRIATEGCCMPSSRQLVKAQSTPNPDPSSLG